MKFDRVVLAFAFVACSAPADGDAPAAAGSAFPSDAYATLTSEAGTYRVEVRTAPVQPPVRGNLDVQIRVVDTNGKAVDGLALGVVPWMPADGHGSSIVPIVTPLGEGAYRVANVDLFMAGSWQLRMTLGANGSTDRATASVDVQ